MKQKSTRMPSLPQVGQDTEQTIGAPAAACSAAIQNQKSQSPTEMTYFSQLQRPECEKWKHCKG